MNRNHGISLAWIALAAQVSMSHFAWASPSVPGPPPGSLWTLETSKITYTVRHLVKTVTGVSQEAKGKVRCDGDPCQILVAAPLATFESGDSSRDIHMIETTRGALHPVVIVRSALARSALQTGSELVADLEVELAGKKATYRGVRLTRAAEDDGTDRISGEIPLRLKDFSIVPPSLLTVEIDDLVPVQVELRWRKG